MASEVRTLAQRSATAAQEIKALIDESVSHVGSGSQQIHNAGGTSGKELVSNVRQVRQLMGEIRVAGEEQRKGVSLKLRWLLPKWTAPFSKTPR